MRVLSASARGDDTSTAVEARGRREVCETAALTLRDATRPAPLGTAAAVLLLVALIVWWSGPMAELTTTIDLSSRFDSAQKQSDLLLERAFSVTLVGVNGDTRRGIFAHPVSKLVWHLAIPENARLRAALAVRQEAWSQTGDGVVFSVGVAAGGRYDELLRQHVNPMVWAADRRWVPVTVDLSRYGSQEADLILSTETGPDPSRFDSRYDWAVWGTPEIVVYR